MSEPLVSVIIAAYNAGEYLRPAVQSVLDQSYSNLEVILVDDGSTDGSTEELSDIRDERLRIVHQPNSGKPTAVNRALDMLHGDFYLLQDADDLSHRHRIARLLQSLLEHPEVAAVFSGYELVMDGRRMAPRFRAKDCTECAAEIERFQMPSHDPTGMYRMSMVGDLRYAEDLSIGQGHDYILRVGERHPMMVLGENLYSYRILPSSVTRADPARRKRFADEVLGRARARRGLPPLPRSSAQDDARMSNLQRDNNLVAHFIESVVDQRRVGDVRGAIDTAYRAVTLHPDDPSYYKPLVLALLPERIGQRLRRSTKRSSSVQ